MSKNELLESCLRLKKQLTNEQWKVAIHYQHELNINLRSSGDARYYIPKNITKKELKELQIIYLIALDC